ncbi:MAG TPA: hypothetical protein VF532_01765 [Candidatus Angelobacter sp.]
MRSLVARLTVSCVLFGTLFATSKPSVPPPGKKVATGQFFEVYVSKAEEKPAPAGYISRVFKVIVVAHTHKHGIQRFTMRMETLDADLLEPKNWEIKDLDGDGMDDFRSLAQVTKKGCQVWPAQRWEKDRERFTSGGPKLARHVDASGKPVANCVLR